MTHPTWDLKATPRELRKVLKDPEDGRFPLFFSRVLSRVPFREVFRHYITLPQFKKYYPRVRRRVDADLLGAGRIPFWEWLYRKIS